MAPFTILALMLLFPVVAPAQDLPGADTVMKNLEKAGDALKSFSADFQQVEIDEFGDKAITSGTAEFLAPGRYLLVSMIKGAPFEEVGKNEKYAWRTRHRNKTVDKVIVKESSKLSDNMNITSPEDLQAHFDLSVTSIDDLATGTAYHLVGKPKEKDSKFKSVEIWVNVENPSPIAKIKSVQKRIVTTIEFTNIRRDIPIDAAKFEYRVPKGYTEVVQ